MRTTLLILLSILSFQVIHGQNLKKAFKYLEAKEYDRAKVIFDQATNTPELAVFGYYGNAMLFIEDDYRARDLYKAYESISNAVKTMVQADEGQWKKISDYISSKEAVPNQQDKIDEMLYQEVKSTNTLEASKKFLNQAKTSSYYKAVQALYAGQRFKEAQEFNTIMAYEDYIKEFPEARDVPLAQQKIYTLAFTEVAKKDKIEEYEAFVEKYPNSPQIEGAKQKILEKEYEMVLLTSTDDAFERFIQKYPDAPQSKELRAKQMQMNYVQARQLNTLNVYNNFLRKFPESPYTKEISSIRDSLAYLQAKSINTPEAYKNFVSKYPNAKQVAQVMELQQNLKYTKAEMAMLKKRQRIADKSISKQFFYRVDKMDSTKKTKVKTIDYDQNGNTVKIWEKTVSGATTEIINTYDEQGLHLIKKRKTVDGNPRYEYTYYYSDKDLLDSARKMCYQPCEDGLPSGSFAFVYHYFPDRNLKEVLITGNNFSRKISYTINNQKLVSQAFIVEQEGDEKKEMKVNYQYDFYDQLIQKSTFSGENKISAVETYFYDKQGNVTKFSAYDALGKIRKTNHYAGNGMLQWVSVEYPNDAANNHKLECAYEFYK